MKAIGKRNLRAIARRLGVESHQLAAGIKRVMAEQPTCACGRPGTHPYFAVPDEPWRFVSAPPAAGKVRIIIGVSCAEHATADFVVRRVQSNAPIDDVLDGRALVENERRKANGGGA